MTKAGADDRDLEAFVGQRVILVRHGRTTLNVEDRLRGLADPELDERGILQAQAVGVALRPRAVSQVLTSPLKRAVHTGQIIADTSGVTCSEAAEFNDRDYGPWTGELRMTVIDRWGAIDHAPGVEPREAVLERVVPALRTLATGCAGSPIVVVTHDAVIRPVLHYVHPGVKAVVPPASWSEIEWSPLGWRVLSVDNHAT